MFSLLFIFIEKRKRHSVKPFPEDWHKLLMDNVLFYRNLSKDRQLIFQQKMMQFLSEVYIDAVQFELEELDKIFNCGKRSNPCFWFLKNGITPT